MTLSTFIAITTVIVPILTAWGLLVLSISAYESHKYEQRKKKRQERR